ncbi:MAG: hypothetical protein JO162_06090 [Alphaproteobacteria bacterium]|nr:hypothetical protein [Alphaproteobacteria bacterium]
MSASAKNPSPEIAGLIAADSGFALVETAFIPGSGGIGRASLWVIAAVSLGSLAAAAGVTIAKDAPPVAMAVAALPAAPDAAPALAAVPAFAPPTAAATVTAAPTAAAPTAAAPTAAATLTAAPTETMPSAPAKNARVLPVVLRGHPPSHAGNRL